MRLNELRVILKGNRFKSPAIGNHGVTNFQQLRSSVTALRDIPILAKEVNRLNKYGGLFIDGATDFVLYADAMASFQDAVDAFKEKLNLAIEILDDLIDAGEDNSVAIRAPSSRDIRAHLQFLEITDKAITQVVSNPIVEGKVELVRYEVGSSWIIIGLGSLIAVKLVAGLFWAATVVRKKWFEGDVLREQVRKMEIANEAQQALVGGLEKSVAQLVELEARNLVDLYDLDRTPEYYERVKASIKMLAELVKDGCTVSPEMISSESISNLFPGTADFKTIASTVKQLADSDSK